MEIQTPSIHSLVDKKQQRFVDKMPSMPMARLMLRFSIPVATRSVGYLTNSSNSLWRKASFKKHLHHGMMTMMMYKDTNKTTAQQCWMELKWQYSSTKQRSAEQSSLGTTSTKGHRIHIQRQQSAFTTIKAAAKETKQQ